MFLAIEVDLEREGLGAQLTDKRLPSNNDRGVHCMRIDSLIKPFLDAFDMDELG